MDKLNFFLALVVGLAAVADFLLGTEGRRRLQRGILNVWASIGDTSFLAVIVDVVGKTRTAILHVVGGGAFGLRYFLTLSTISLLTTTLFLGSGLFIVDAMSNDLFFGGLFGYWRATLWRAVTVAEFETGIYLANWFGDLLSLGITLWLLERMSSATRLRRLIGWLALDVLLSIFLVFLVAWGAAISEGLTEGLSWWTALNPVNPLVLIILAVSGYLDIAVLILPAVTILGPTLVHVAAVTFFVFVKFSEPILKPLSMVILERLVEWQKGIFTLLVTFLVALIKLVQLGLRAFG